MNAAAPAFELDDLDLDTAIGLACSRIAPTWPLDRFIAVNPYWGWRDHQFENAAASLGRLAGSPLYMPSAYFREAWADGLIAPAHLAQAIAESGTNYSNADLVAGLDSNDELRPLPLLSDIVDSNRDLRHAPAWADTIIHQISQHCAAYFDTDQADWRPPSEAGLYLTWRDTIARDHGIRLLMDTPSVVRRAQKLPADPRSMIERAVTELCWPSHLHTSLLTAILLRINGWASWCAYLGWQAQLRGENDEHLVDLLAIRLAWETLLDDGDRSRDSNWGRWRTQWQSHAPPVEHAISAIWQRAAEIAYQAPVAQALSIATKANDSIPASVQAVFCIDVRSEVFRRSLERVSADVQTMGFAGFFGLPIAYTPLGTKASRPQLPGLLAPALQVTDTAGDGKHDADLGQLRLDRLSVRHSGLAFQRLPSSAFTLVETLGLGYLGKLIGRTLGLYSDSQSCDHDGFTRDEARSLRPHLVTTSDQTTGVLDVAERVLRAMSLTTDFARLVLLVGHGSRSTNNPHAGGLDCGACCGQTGEVNARVLAGILNAPSLRQGLADRGLIIPSSTHFLPALHNTTTDEVILFDTDDVPASHARDIEQLRLKLAEAGHLARAERAEALGLTHLAGQASVLLAAVKNRAGDWAQTRPEWGLANNAAFIVAPRRRTRGLNLAGRSFLHDYDWRQDTKGSVLELIMTAPMIVTHWINMQYYASTVDNLRFGSGNKVLHNVVGGHLGVFEGNGGDLRIGLPRQSLHDGTRWMHTPLRLSVFIEAPRQRIASIIARHETVRQLINHRWLYLFLIDPETGSVESYVNGAWVIRDANAEKAS